MSSAYELEYMKVLKAHRASEPMKLPMPVKK